MKITERFAQFLKSLTRQQKMTWGLAAALTLVALVFNGWRSGPKIDRTPMLLVLTRYNDLMAEIECYVGPSGDPVWHGEAIAYGSDGDVELAKAQFRDGKFVSGTFADGERPATPDRIYHMKQVISCEHFEHISTKLVPWPRKHE